MDLKHSPIRLRRFLEELERRDTPAFVAAPASTASITSLPSTIATADFNGDGFADTAIGNMSGLSPGTVGIALSNGDGTFKAMPAITNANINTPQSIVAADFNGDGHIDLAIASSDGGPSATGSLLVFLGDGKGNFTGPVFQTNTPTMAIGVADFDGDTIPDLIAVIGSGDIIEEGYQFLKGNGDGTFTASAEQSFPIDVNRVVTGDFDGDGKQDFIALDDIDNQMLPFFGQGTGLFDDPTASPSTVVALGSRPSDIIAGDFNGDGKTDAVVATDAGIILFVGVGSRQFGNGQEFFTTPSSASGYSRLAAADVNQDGIPDVIAVRNSDALVFTTDNTTTPISFKQDPPYAIPGVTGGVDVAAGDLNGDGPPDFIVARGSEDANPSNAVPFINLALIPTNTSVGANPIPGEADSVVTLTATIIFEGKPYPLGTVPGNTVTFTSDGITIGSAPVIGNVATLPATFLVGSHTILAIYSGDTRFKTSTSLPFPLPVNPPPPVSYQYQVSGLPTLPNVGPDRVASGNFTDDGVPDILLGSGGGRPAQITIIDGQTRANLATAFPFGIDYTGGVMVAAGDIDGNGLDDIAVSADTTGGPRIQIYLTQNVGGTLTLLPLVSFYALDPNFHGGLRIALGDVNRDGHADLVVVGGPGAGPRVATYNGLSLLSGEPERLFNDFYAMDPDTRQGMFVAVGDLNGDGFAEIAVSSDAGGSPRVNVFDGASFFAPISTVVEVANFFAGDPDSRGGVRIAIRNVTSDPEAGVQLIAGDGPGPVSTVRLYNGRDVYMGGTPTEIFENEVMAGFTGGVYVA